MVWQRAVKVRNDGSIPRRGKALNKLRIHVFWYVRLRHWVSVSRRFESRCSLHLQGFQIIRNVRNRWPCDAASHPRRRGCSVTPLWEPQNHMTRLIHSAYERVQWPALVNTVMNFFLLFFHSFTVHVDSITSLLFQPMHTIYTLKH